jgi:hypothetical protein
MIALGMAIYFDSSHPRILAGHMRFSPETKIVPQKPCPSLVEAKDPIAIRH